MSSASSNDGSVDVDALMATLRQRVQEKKAQGLYRVDELVSEALDGDEPWDSQRLEELHEQALVEQKIVVPESTRPVVGPVIERTKRFVIKAGWHNLSHVTEQTSSFNAGIISYVGSLGTEVARLRHEVDRLSSEAGTESLDDLDGRLRAMEARAVEDRIARLEQRLEGPVAEAPPLRPAGQPLDDLRLDAWLGSDDRQALSEAIGETERALHLNCGAGEILDDAGGIGVDARSDLVAKARETGRDVIYADPVAYVASSTSRSRDAVTVAGLVEELEPAALGALVQGIGACLTPGGIAAISVRNPQSEEELRQFWRDPRRRRPIDPQTVAFLLECEGLSQPELRWREEDGSGTPRSCIVVAKR